MGACVVGGDVVDADVVTVLGEAKGDSFANAARGARHDAGFVAGWGGGEPAGVEGEAGKEEGAGDREGAGEG